jgi:hypothetical protein
MDFISLPAIAEAVATILWIIAVILVVFGIVAGRGAILHASYSSSSPLIGPGG